MAGRVLEARMKEYKFPWADSGRNLDFQDAEVRDMLLETGEGKSLLYNDRET